jgi:hypothetical protein
VDGSLHHSSVLCAWYRSTVRSLAIWTLVAAGGCNNDDASTAFDLSIGSPDQGDTLMLSVGGQSRPMAAYYSFYIEPLSTQGRVDAFLVITAVDPAFDCANAATGLDAAAFLFAVRGDGAYTANVLSRRGPVLGALVDSVGSAELGVDDSGLHGYDLDAGTVSASGFVTGRIELVGGKVRLAGPFNAGRCAALDFIVPG